MSYSSAVLVVFEQDVHDEDITGLCEAFERFRGVISVEPVPADTLLHVATRRARHELVRQLNDVLWARDQGRGE